LLPSLQHDISILPDFTTAQISFSALQEECEAILASATGAAKSIFEMGQSTSDGSPDGGKVNWVIYWLLWQAKDLLALERKGATKHGHQPTNNDSAQAGGERPRHDGERVFWDPARNL
jgi:hypothetical protein